ncbi:hypothetical protein IAT38_006078 [Cryptococcus sp. DSM 104549]
MPSLPRSLSPIPRSTSPNPPPRASISSNRSALKSEADFEAALLNPQQTLYLSAGPTAIGEEPDSESIAASTPGLEPPLGILPPGEAQGGREKANASTSPVPAQTPGEGRTVEMDPEAPLPVDKRSFDEDMRRAGKPDMRVGLGVGPVGPRSPVKPMQSPGVIPPTPTTAYGHARRGSEMTTASTTSTGTADTPTRAARRVSKSLGIEAELGIETKKKTAPPPKRRSIFRAAGTASQPDLNSIVRKKDSSAKSGRHEPPPSAGPTTTSTPIPPLPTSSSSRVLHKQANREPSPGSGTVTGRPQSRDRSMNDPKYQEDMGRYGAMMGGNQMATIAEGAGALSRNKSNTSDDGFKSMRNKAKGMFGKMFGASKDSRSSDQSPSSSQFGHDPEYSRPPVPPVPSAYSSTQRTVLSPTLTPSSSDVFGTVDESPRTLRTPSSSAQEKRARSPSASVTPTEAGNRRTSDGSVLSVDKPLPALRDGSRESSPSRANGSKRGSGTLHIRQPASVAEADETPSRENSIPRPAPSPATAAVSSFSDDMAGMLANIGQSEPARELGLPPESLRDRSRGRAEPIETGKEGLRGRFTTGLAKSTSDHGTGLLLSPPPNPRTSSLPTIHSSLSPKPDTSAGPSVPKRNASTPSPVLTSESLMPTVGHASRSSSLSSHQRSTEGKEAPLPLRPADDIPPLLPQSVKLVSSSRSLVGSNHTGDSGGDPAKSFINTSPWGKQSPRQPSPHEQREGEVEVMVSPPQTPATNHESGNGNGDANEEGSAADVTEDEEERGRRLACEILENDTTNVQGDKVAEFLGGPRPINRIALRYYMQYFDMKGQNLVEAFRDLCQKLYLKAESQEIDRIIEAFSARYFECNPTTVFGTPGVVHTVAAAMLMLNTDLHIAELNKHMSRTDFVRNAMRAIQESMPAEDRASTPDLVRDNASTSNKPSLGSSSSMATSFASVRAKTPTQPPTATPRSASAPVVTSPVPHRRADSSLSASTSTYDGKSRSSSFSYTKSWELEAEAALKDIYSAVRADRILLPISGMGGDRNVSGSSNRQSILSIGSNGPFDYRSKTALSPSDRVNVLKRGSIRGSQSLVNNPYGSAWSQSEGRLSPTGSYATSIDEGGYSNFAPTLGFASNLSHTVIREQDDEVNSIHSRSSVGTVEDMDDDELALLGAPWAKEGLLSRKLAFESVTKRVKKSDWKQYFVVVSKGDLFMFTFGDKGGSGFMGGSVGGGNWLENANAIGTISLMHSTAAALPKPGYSNNRPYCFSLTQSSGESSIFQAGTEDLVAEWVGTCNYWAARKSRQPLQGGVSNMEYGWNRAVDPVDDQEDRMSVMSHRSNVGRLGGTYGRRTMGNGAGGVNDRIYINDWKPPPPAMMPSPLEEESQLEALQAYVKSQVVELEQHKAIEEPMNRLYTSGSKNLTKARENWKAKSHFIHTEIFKYETYVEALRNAIALRVKKQGEKKLEKSLATSMSSLAAIAEGRGAGGDAGSNAYEKGGAQMGALSGKVADLQIDPHAEGGYDDDEEQPLTPNATIRGR